MRITYLQGADLLIIPLPSVAFLCVPTEKGNLLIEFSAPATDSEADAGSEPFIPDSGFWRASRFFMRYAGAR